MIESPPNAKKNLAANKDRFALWLLTAVFGAIAVTGWFAPSLLFEPIGISFSEPAGLAEVRAAYGGHFAAFAVLFAHGAMRPSFRSTAFGFAALVLGGFVFGRLVSLGLDGAPNILGWVNLTAESVGCALALMFWRRQSTQQANKPS